MKPIPEAGRAINFSENKIVSTSMLLQEHGVGKNRFGNKCSREIKSEMETTGDFFSILRAVQKNLFNFEFLV